MHFHELVTGQLLVDEQLIVSEEALAAYLTAVESAQAPDLGIPPLALTAYALAMAMRAVQLPAGSVHTGQELAVQRLARSGEPLQCTVNVGQASERQGTHFVSLDLTVRDSAGLILTGRSSLAAPVEGRI